VIGVLSAKDNGIKEVTIDLMGYGDQMFGPDEYEEAGIQRRRSPPPRWSRNNGGS
jgi:hypothetical protein